MSHVGKKLREDTIFGFTSVVQIAKWLLHSFRLEAVFLSVWQGSIEVGREALGKTVPKGPLVYNQML
jgi:hypothetical protein